MAYENWCSNSHNQQVFGCVGKETHQKLKNVHTCKVSKFKSNIWWMEKGSESLPNSRMNLMVEKSLKKHTQTNISEIECWPVGDEPKGLEHFFSFWMRQNMSKKTKDLWWSTLPKTNIGRGMIRQQERSPDSLSTPNHMQLQWSHNGFGI